MIFIFPAFTLSPFSSIASFEVKSLLTHSLSNSLMTRRSQNLGEHQPSLQTLHCTPHQHRHGSEHWHTSPAPVAQSTPPHHVFSVPTRWLSEALGQTPSPGLQKPCRVCWQLDTSLAAADYKDCVCCASAWDVAKLTVSSVDTNCLMRPSTILSRTVHNPLQFSPGLSWPAVLAWERSRLPFPVDPPYSCRGRQWNSAPSQRVPCLSKWLQLQGHRSWRCPCHRLLVSSPPLSLMGPVLCQPSSER